jgi:glycosyltransferase involved in cell wall biosynthesis
VQIGKDYDVSNSKLRVLPYYCENSNGELIELRNGERKLLFIANNFIHRKGYDVLFDAFRALEMDGLLDQYEIVIAGHGELLEYYSKKFKELSSPVKILGWISKDQYDYYMATCAIFVHASYFEPFGIPPLDAMRRRKVVVSSLGVKSAEEIIVHGVNGFLFSPGSALQLFEILKNLSYFNLNEIGVKAESSVCKFYEEHSISRVIASSL